MAGCISGSILYAFRDERVIRYPGGVAYIGGKEDRLAKKITDNATQRKIDRLVERFQEIQRKFESIEHWASSKPR